MELSSSEIKSILMSWEMELFGSNIFSKESFSYISGNGNPQKLLIFQEATFRARKKKLLMFQERTGKT